ncbi:hypothetical protein DYB38_013332 [Aphanomyces astaci]|uniref:subtilisin n=1 Tax=Aphanomyces astaci TaxID=112090 RepID=A0A397FJH0_APHAT|nr:hypothetical protein DYB34_013290 [Aphanomyces astaci]RHY43029.1 hypothetical protein DYB38_013332 [Aphanomyces astaci]RHZ30301.1 hypothetical protein DYB31_010825 [Aphanomyces astaci]
MQLSAFAIAVLAALLTHDVSAVGCTPDQKQQMLDAITTHPSWPACQQATEPFDFFLALTQQGPKPTANDLAKFQAAAPCNTVYASFQDAIKRANCDEVAELVELLAPGMFTQSAGIINNTKCVKMEGTSIVSPNVADVVGIVKRVSPKAKSDQVHTSGSLRVACHHDSHIRGNDGDTMDVPSILTHLVLLLIPADWVNMLGANSSSG